ncbi:TonB-dependent receptor [Segetibacter aerophilus]|uniref:Cell envelope biogenesis protein OmpA n=1 Tax=Segetibacter aerophilus TaxID=670293 RepID=A0A512BB03_9BACT|nr:TonB-dependent receptor [Segetibacter aerophilus]GEO09156.1 cell envelope biogenesis protein OmpA [Segetibacter aerophilus]
MLIKRILPLILVFFAPFLVIGQVTTSNISGTVTSSSGPLAGATITATHLPTGTIFRSSSLSKGVYNLVNMIPGGPYKLDVSFVGYSTFSQDSIYLALGENTRIDVPLANTSSTLAEVVVTGIGGGTRRKTGAATSISRAQINALPTLSRSLQDYTRLTPQANGNSFGGASNRYNNITIDGAVNNDVFGLSGSGTPGGQASTTPISLDAIQEIQVVLAPYDITYGNFTGGGVNAVTRSGTNKVDGSVYYFLRNQNTIGKDPITREKATSFSDKQYGARFGGPIIKNKLFFFVNAELARRTAPTLFNAGENQSLLTTEEAKTLAAYMQTKYGYDAGSYDTYNAQTQSNKYFARIDWNINEKNRLTIRHNYIKAYDDNISRSATLFRFGNNTYRFNNSQNITVVELRTRFSNTYSNDLILTSQRIRDFRSTYGSLFPQVEISKGSGTIQLGSERSSTANELDQDIYELTDNFKIFKGKNTFTIGTHNEFFKFRNLFINNLYGRWNFNSLNDFYNNNPRQVQVTYSNIPGETKPSAAFSAAQLGFYAQDEIQVNPQFRITAGLRLDVPVFGDKPGYNPIVDTTFKGKYNTSNIPNGQLLWSPRVGFNYDVTGQKSLIIRGGAGIFSGRVPFVWISNQFSNSGLLLNTINVSDNTATPANEVNNGNGFQPDPLKQSTLGTAGKTFEADVIDQKFKLPQVARFNLATDIKLPGGVMATFEGIYSKTLNNILYQDVNLTAPVGVVDPVYNNGADKRIAYSTSTNGRRLNPNITNAILITNTNQGYTYNLTAQFSKTWKNAFVQVAYNHNDSKDVNSGASSTALSNWEFVQVVGNPNAPQLSKSSYALTHRITGVMSFNLNYTKFMRTSLAFFYSANSGQRFTYVVNGDLNSDGRFGNDLIYIPRNTSEINFVDFLNTNNTVRYTAAQQAAAFESFVRNDKYLNSRRGDYAERNGSSTPWEHVVDMRFAQDFFVTKGENKHTLQLTFDVFNLTNLLNKDWGRQYFVGNQAYNVLTAVNRTTGANIGKGYNFSIGQDPWNMNFSSRFQGQIGLRYSFN